MAGIKTAKITRGDYPKFGNSKSTNKKKAKRS